MNPTTDHLGREHIEIEGSSFTLLKIIPFEVWIRKKYKSFDAFLNLKFQDRETVFLRWKWGCGDESNRDLEISERYTVHLLKGEDFGQLSAALKFYFEKKLSFEEYCKEVRNRIGLRHEKKEDLPTEEQRLVGIFDGEIE